MDTCSEIDSVLTQWYNNGYIELKIGFLSTMAFHSKLIFISIQSLQFFINTMISSCLHLFHINCNTIVQESFINTLYYI